MIGLLNCLCSDHQVLIVMHPHICLAFIMDSLRSLEKDYTLVRDVMDDALFHFHTHGGCIKKIKKRKGSSLPGFRVNEKFPCLQQPAHSVMDSYYVIHHISEYVRAVDTLDLAKDVVKWGQQLEKKKGGDQEDELSRIQVKLADILNKDVIDEQGVFHGGEDTPEEVMDRLRQQGEDTSFNTYEGIRPFLPTKK